MLQSQLRNIIKEISVWKILWVNAEEKEKKLSSTSVFWAWKEKPTSSASTISYATKKKSGTMSIALFTMERRNKIKILSHLSFRCLPECEVLTYFSSFVPIWDEISVRLQKLNKYLLKFFGFNELFIFSMYACFSFLSLCKHFIFEYHQLRKKEFKQQLKPMQTQWSDLKTGLQRRPRSEKYKLPTKFSF